MGILGTLVFGIASKGTKLQDHLSSSTPRISETLKGCR